MYVSPGSVKQQLRRESLSNPSFIFPSPLFFCVEELTEGNIGKDGDAEEEQKDQAHKPGKGFLYGL